MSGPSCGWCRDPYCTGDHSGDVAEISPGAFMEAVPPPGRPEARAEHGGHDVWGLDFGEVGWHQPEATPPVAAALDADSPLPGMPSPSPVPDGPPTAIVDAPEADEDEAADPPGDLKAELGEARSEAAMIRDHANRYLRAVHGPDYVYRAPETFGNLLERWIWAVSAGVPEMAHACIADIERHCAERQEARDD